MMAQSTALPEGTKDVVSITTRPQVSRLQEENITARTECCKSITSSDLRTLDLDAVLAECQSYLESPTFREYCHRQGVQGGTFSWWGPPMILLERMKSTLKQEMTPKQSSKTTTLGIVFHGTPQQNLDSILNFGLDPSLRRGQAFGKGEYFSKDPGTSVTYCHGGCSMLVFLVLVPEKTNDSNKMRASTGAHSINFTNSTSSKNSDTTSRLRDLRRSNLLHARNLRQSMADSYVVVENSAHQLPLGVLTFSSMTPDVIARSKTMRSYLHVVNQEARQEEQRLLAANKKAEIIQLLIQGEMQMAAHKFQKVVKAGTATGGDTKNPAATSTNDYDEENNSLFSKACILEIGYYVHQHFDEDDMDLIDYYFGVGTIPSKMDCTWDKINPNIESVEQHQARVEEARNEVEKASQKLQTHIQSMYNHQSSDDIKHRQFGPSLSGTQREFLECKAQKIGWLAMVQYGTKKQLEGGTRKRAVTDILQWILQGDLEAAGHKFRKYQRQFSDTEKREIVDHANRQADASLIELHFGENAFPSNSQEEDRRPDDTCSNPAGFPVAAAADTSISNFKSTPSWDSQRTVEVNVFVFPDKGQTQAPTIPYTPAPRTMPTANALSARGKAQTRSAPTMNNETPIPYLAPESIGLGHELIDSILVPCDTTSFDCGEQEDEACPLCLCGLIDDTVFLKMCGHKFHKTCIQETIRTSSSASRRCPVCRCQLGEPVGMCPSGEMTIQTTNRTCAGYEECPAIQIRYVLPSGVQSSFHENPGHQFHGTTRVAYLPDCAEGNSLLVRLIYAFRHGLTFTVGTSMTTGSISCITWGSIHHKTSLNGGIRRHGYPDLNYIRNCNEELNALGVPPGKDIVREASESLNRLGVKTFQN